jgi:hypothetical protein
MCHALFLGSSKPLDLVSFRDAVWFGVEELHPRHEAIRLHFGAGWHVYYLNSHEACGCGFHSDERFVDEDEDSTYDQESRRCLADYLRRALRDSSVALALYDCWEGDEWKPIRSHGEATPELIESQLDPVPAGSFVRIRRSIELG